MAKKASETFSEEQATAIHSEINAENSVDGRKKIYARHGLTVGTGPRLFKEKGLSKVVPAKVPSKKAAAWKAQKKAAKASPKAVTTAPTPEPKKKTQAPKAAPAKKATSPGLEEDVRQLIALQARVISRLMGNE